MFYIKCISCFSLSLSPGLKEEVVGTVSLRQFQENVFVEGDRPKYVLDLHTEAQQGLKLQQQEGRKTKVKNQSVFVKTLPLTLNHMCVSFWHTFYYKLESNVLFYYFFGSR